MPLRDKAGFAARLALATALVMSIITGVGWMLIRPPLPGPAAADATTGQKPIFGPGASWDLVEDGPGSWRGAARLSAGGRWALEVDLNGETVSLPFESAPATR